MGIPTALMTLERENAYAAWFGRLVLLGVATNMILAIYGLVAPASLLALFKLEPPASLVWPRFAALLLLLLSLFYILPGLRPLHTPWASVLAVAARAAGVAFFGLFHGAAYLPFALYDLAYGLPQGVLLALAFRHARAAPGGQG
jgi:hypothetical protein